MEEESRNPKTFEADHGTLTILVSEKKLTPRVVNHSIILAYNLRTKSLLKLPTTRTSKYGVKHSLLIVNCFSSLLVYISWCKLVPNYYCNQHQINSDHGDNDNKLATKLVQK